MSSPNKLYSLRKNQDYISELPDTILCLILSLLSTKSVVKTSILSKRWNYLWIKVPALDITEVHQRYEWLNLEQKICFKSFVDKVLLHNDVSYLQRFCLDVFDVDDIYVTSWLTNASGREMHELCINIRRTSQLRTCLPPRLLSSERLVVLKLKGHLIIGTIMNLNLHLPNAETIELDGLKFVDDGFLKRLLSSCSLLKELHIVDCYGMPKLLDVESLTLESLTIKQECFNYYMVIKEFPTYFVINTPNVRYLCLHGTLSHYIIGDMCALTEADLDVVYCDEDYDNHDEDDNEDEDKDLKNRISALKKLPVDCQAQELIRKVSGVKTLRIGYRISLQRVGYQNFIKNKKLPVFPNLTCLGMEAGELMRDLLKCAPNLKSLEISTVDYDCGFAPELAPKHLPSLENIVVERFNGESEDIVVIEYFLEAASALKNMYVRLNCSVSLKSDDNDVLKEILSLPRSSPVCEVNISSIYDSE
ncbi:hypothetical protein SOVF_156290 [Spinacia oleracea]|nr:hypothetical protein SOVF_156290 [Spinacia oleracea]